MERLIQELCHSTIILSSKNLNTVFCCVSINISMYLIDIKSLLTGINEIIHFDADMMILTKLENIWQKFKEFSSNEILGAAVDCGTSK